MLQVATVVRSEAFYTEKLGFRSDGTWGDPPAFCIVQRGAVTIMLDRSREGGPLPVNQYWAAYVYVDDADALHRDFDVRDPDGHLIAFGHDLEPGPAGPAVD